MAGYTTGDGWQRLFIAGQDGVRPFVLGPPQWLWRPMTPVLSHPGIVDLTAYFHAGDGQHHCFAALQTGDIFECRSASFEAASPTQELWLGNLSGGAVGLAGVSTTNSQHLFVAGPDGLVHELEISAATQWQWYWRGPIAAPHQGIRGVAAYLHPGDQALHVLIALDTGDVWELLRSSNPTWSENWLGILDGGASAFTGHSAPNSTQHLFACGASKRVFPLQIGPPHWRWRWDAPLTDRHDAVVELASYYHDGDRSQHLFALLGAGDLWEYRFPLRTSVATSEVNLHDVPVTYWFGPLDDPSDQILRGRYQLVADAGFTLAFPPGDGYLDVRGNGRHLDAAARAGLQMVVADVDIGTIVQTVPTLDAPSKVLLDKVVDNYSGHSAFAGYFVADEPASVLFPIISEVVAYIRARDPGHFCYVNLLPSHAGTKGPEIDAYVNQVRPSLLSFDHYSLLNTGLDEPTFIENLHIMRSRSLLHDLPFWTIVLLVQHLSYREPTAAEKRYEAMQVLAFGGSGLSWFTYWQPPYPSDGYQPAIVDSNGSPTSQYADVVSINADVKTLARHLSKSRSTHVFEAGVLPVGGTPAPQGGIVRVRNNVDVTVGIFTVQQPPLASSATEALVLVASRNYSAAVTASLDFSCQFLLKLDKSTDTWTTLPFSTGVQVPLSAGDAELFRLIF